MTQIHRWLGSLRNFESSARDTSSSSEARESWHARAPVGYLPKLHPRLDFCHTCFIWLLGYDLNLLIYQKSSINDIINCASGWLQGSLSCQTSTGNIFALTTTNHRTTKLLLMGKAKFPVFRNSDYYLGLFIEKDVSFNFLKTESWNSKWF